MTRTALLSAALAGGLLLPATAKADIVKAPTGEKSRLSVSAATVKTLKRHKVTLSASGAAKKSATTFELPYSLSRWDFGTRDGDVAHFAKNTGFKLKRGKRSVAVVHPRLIMDTSTRGYVTALIANERIKVFTVSGSAAKATDTTSVQQIAGLRLKLTQAGANYVNRGLKKKALKRFSQFGTLDLRLRKPATAGGGGGGTGGGTGGGGGGTPPGQGDTPGATVTVNPGFLGLLPGGTLSPLLPNGGYDLDGDGRPDAGVSTLPLEDVQFDADTRTGSIKLGGGLVLDLPGLGGRVELVNPEIVIGATDDASGLYANVNGARVKVGDIDTDTLALNLGDDTITIDDLDVTVGGALTPLLQGVLGSGAIPAGTPLLSLDLSFPRV